MSAFKGVAKARRRAKARPGILDREVVDAIGETVEAVHSTGRVNIDAMVTRRTGTLRRLYGKSVKKAQKTGQVGQVSRVSKRKAFYARFVHDGTRYAIGRPFHDLAVASEAARHRVRMLAALKAALRRAGRG